MDELGSYMPYIHTVMPYIYIYKLMDRFIFSVSLFWPFQILIGPVWT